jgi:hypothetical protein
MNKEATILLHYRIIAKIRVIDDGKYGIKYHIEAFLDAGNSIHDNKIILQNYFEELLREI